MKAPATITLDPAAVYLSPQGLRCTFVPSEGERFQQRWATLMYCRPDGAPRQLTDSNVWSHSFSLMPANFHILRRLS